MAKRYQSGAQWESRVGYSRAIRVGDQIEVSGTISIKDGKVHGEGDPYLQAKRVFEIIEEAIEHVGGTMHHVVRTRMYVTNIAHWEAVGKAHGEVFGDVRPATSLVEVSALIAPEYLVEIEATAIVRDRPLDIAGSDVL